MAEESFPFQELAEGDRTVSAAMFAKHLGFIRTRGVIQGLDNQLAVTESSPQAMSVDVDTGGAFVGLTEQRAYRNTLARTLTVAAADGSNPRDDLVVLRMDTASGVRSVVLAVVTGTPAGSPVDPTLTQTEALYELPRYRLRVGAAVSVITNADLTDLRGTADPAAAPFSQPANFPSSASGLTREGGNTTEATTTSTSAVDFVSLTSLSLATNIPLLFQAVIRKTSGAADDGGFGLKINATVTGEAVAASTSALAYFSTSNRIEVGGFYLPLGTPVSGYALGAAMGTFAVHPTAGAGTKGTIEAYRTADDPGVTRTSIILRAISGNASITIGADEVHLYSQAVE